VLALPVALVDDEMLEHAARTLIVAAPAASASTVCLPRLASRSWACLSFVAFVIGAGLPSP
jgi:hypothetical protein